MARTSRRGSGDGAGLKAGEWHGVMPAITTPFTDADATTIDLDFLGSHARWMCERGCSGIVSPGSLGEGATLNMEERIAIWRTLVPAVAPRPVVAAIAAASTADAVAMARHAHEAGCRGLMVLPPYVFKGTWEELAGHVKAVAAATPLGCMLYNNPAAYGVDFLPERIVELTLEIPNLHAVKESSGDARRVTAIRALCGSRLAVFVGLDDCLLEGVRMGAHGWVAGLANAMPEESVALFDDALRGDYGRAETIYRWFLPLLRMDVDPLFVQLIKLVQAQVGMGREHVRAPRLPVSGPAREEALRVIRAAAGTRPLGASRA
ncbi:MAG: dihydrodipicolinate synthase family protein [Phycisphaerales bacterium]